MSLTRLEWDSAWFGIAIARADPGDPLLAAAQADAAGIDCLYLLLPTDADGPMRAAQAAGYRVVDLRVELDKQLTGDERVPAEVRALSSDDLPALEAICRERFRDSRFMTDPGFPAERARELYVAWLDRGRSTPERYVLVSEPDAGFVICHEAGDSGTIELIAASRAGRGTGVALVAGADASFAEHGLERARVVTQARNIAALRLYGGCGYSICSTAYWLHRWRDGISR